MPRRPARLSVSPEKFEALVRRAIESVPPEYARLLKNVAVVVEEEPPPDVLAELGAESEDDVLGLYTGTAIDEESFFSPGGGLPPKIAIYRGPILRLCRSPAEVVQEVRDTVVHEIGHHFGLEDEDMPY